MSNTREHYECVGGNAIIDLTTDSDCVSITVTFITKDGKTLTFGGEMQETQADFFADVPESTGNRPNIEGGEARYRDTYYFE